MNTFDFVRGTWPGEMVPCEHLPLICNAVDDVVSGRYPRTMIWTPPGLGKSMVIERAIASVIARDPKSHQGIISYSDDIARRGSRAVRDLLREPWVDERFPGLEFARETETGWQLDCVGQDKRLTCVPRGILSSISGHRFDYTWVDDPVKNRRDAFSEDIRRRTFENFVSAVVSRSSHFGKFVIIMTRWHAKDLCGQLLDIAKEKPNAPQWRVVNIAATNDNGNDSYIFDSATGEYRYLAPYSTIFEHLYPRPFLEQVKALYPASYNSLYMGNPMPGEEQLFPPDNWLLKDNVNTDAIEYIVSAWDLSVGRHDNSANLVLARMKTGEYLVLDCWAKCVPIDEILPIIIARYDRIIGTYRSRPFVGIEDASTGSDAIAMLRRMRPDIPVLPFKPGADNKEERAQFPAAIVKSGVVFLGPGEWRDDFIHELSCFPGGGKFDDRADAFVYALRSFMGTKDDIRDPRRLLNPGAMLAPGKTTAPQSYADLWDRSDDAALNQLLGE